MIIYNKLVRDRIPEIIQESGEECLVEVLTEHDYLKELQKRRGRVKGVFSSF
ncbi:hypothetical protein [Priestia megaterium]|uniref:hypothetical protein n=1 Tax=Priestia megaterium TaxID=1404 RepID=UPI0027E2C16C|nr:hypothetical protein [Priestia megaterium]